MYILVSFWGFLTIQTFEDSLQEWMKELVSGTRRSGSNFVDLGFRFGVKLFDLEMDAESALQTVCDGSDSVEQ